MVLILKIATSWKQNDVFGDKPIRCFRILGWIYLIHGIIGQGWGIAGQFIGASNTGDIATAWPKYRTLPVVNSSAWSNPGSK
jgi:hypothetical protein